MTTNPLPHRQSKRGRPSEGKDARIELRTTPERKAKAQAAASEQGITVSDLLNKMIDALPV